MWGLPDSPDDTPAVSASVTPTPTRLRGAVPAPSPAGKVAAGWPIFGWWLWCWMVELYVWIWDIVTNIVASKTRCWTVIDVIVICVYIYSSIYIYTHFFDTLYVQTLYLHFIIWCLHFVHVATLWLPKLTYVFLLHFGQRFTSGTLNQSHGAAVALCFMYNEDSKFPARDVAHRFKQFRLEVWNMMKAVWNAFWSDKVTSRHLPFVGVLLY